METQSPNNFRKSVYIFLTAFLGILLFLILHRFFVFIYLMLIAADYNTFGLGMTYLQFLAFDYITLFFVILLGAWYGIWLGLYWYKKVYEEGSHKGVVDHIVSHYWPKTKESVDLETKIADVREKLESDLWQMEELARNPAVNLAGPEPIKRPIVRKRVPAKIKKANIKV